MTLPLPKKHQTTQRSMLRSTRFSLLSRLGRWRPLCLVMAFICSPAFAEPPGGRVTPLERLKQRSAHNRWQSAKRELTTSQKVMQPQQVPAVAPPQSFNQQQQIPAVRTAEAIPHVAEPAPAVNLPGEGNVPATSPAIAEPVFTLSDEVAQPAASPALTAQQSGETTRIAPRIVFDGQDQGQSIIVPPIAQGQEVVSVPPSPSALEPVDESRPIQLSQVPSNPSDLTRGRMLQDVNELFRPISEITPSANYRTDSVAGQKRKVNLASLKSPDVIPLPSKGSLDRYFHPVNYQWEATNIFHNPLYFQDASLERYGHTYPDCVQPFISVGKFGVQLAGLPYQMALASPCNKEYVLGYLDPGDCNPPLIYQVPFNLRAAGVAAGTYTGLIFLFP